MDPERWRPNMEGYFTRGDPGTHSNLTGRFPGIGITADRLVFRDLPGIVDRWLLQGVLVRIVHRLFAPGGIDRLAGIAIAAGGGRGDDRGGFGGWEEVPPRRGGGAKNRAGPL